MKTSLCVVEVSVAGFTGEFTHCDQVANYLATTVSLEQPDPFQYSNALSLIINEVLETLHQSDRPESRATVEILAEDRTLHIVLGVDAGDHLLTFYAELLGQAATPAAWEEIYRGALLGGPLRRDLGVLRLLADHRASITFPAPAPGRALIEVSVLLDDSIEVST